MDFASQNNSYCNNVCTILMIMIITMYQYYHYHYHYHVYVYVCCRIIIHYDTSRLRAQEQHLQVHGGGLRGQTICIYNITFIYIYIYIYIYLFILFYCLYIFVLISFLFIYVLGEGFFSFSTNLESFKKEI